MRTNCIIQNANHTTLPLLSINYPEKTLSRGASLKVINKNLDANTYSKMANAIRVLTIDAVEAANSGHPGMPMGMADVATLLFSEFLKFDPKNPKWVDRDRFVLSAGHGSMLIYALLYLTGYSDISLDEIKNFRQFGSKTAGHPEYGEIDGVETTTGPLGQGFANAVGMAMAERQLSAKFGKEIVDHNTYCIVGDGCLMEGISHEAASLAGHQRLGKLIVLFDDNGISIDGSTDLTVSDDHIERFKAYGWHTASADGHDFNAIRSVICQAKDSSKPSFLAFKTQIGFGSPNKGGTAACHGAPLGADEIELVRSTLNWSEEPFVIPESIIVAWRKLGEKGGKEEKAWQERLNQLENGQKQSFKNTLKVELNSNALNALQNYKIELVNDKPNIATRVASQKTLEVLTPVMPCLIGGSADLSGSNNTKTGDHQTLSKDNPTGNYVHYGVREHAMAAAMNGMSLHGGVIPYGGTFLVFTDYCRPSIRLSALMKLRVIYVMTHDSIGLGEDGPTHQPVEHLSALRSIPNLNVYRPADAVETLECWEHALKTSQTPSIIALSRQNLPLVRHEDEAENLCSRGGYIIKRSSQQHTKVTIVATGSEVSIALNAQSKLEKDDIPTCVVSMPCLDIFNAQNEKYQNSVITPESDVIVVEAGVQQSWDKLLGKSGAFIGMDSFGASAPAKDLFNHYKITAEEIIKVATKKFV